MRPFGLYSPRAFSLHGFSRQEYCHSFLQDLPNPGFNPSFLCLLHCKQILHHWTTVKACSIFSLPLFSSKSQWYQGFWSFLAYCGCSHHFHSLTHCLSSGFFFAFKIAQNLNSGLKYLSWLKDGCVVFLIFFFNSNLWKE